MKILSPVSFLLAALVALQAQADLRYKVQTKTEGGPKGGGGTQLMQLTAAGDKARMEFLEGGPVQEGGYILTKDGGKSMTLVNPKDKTYMSWDMDAMMGMVGAMGGMMKMEVTDPKVEKLLDEAGEPLLGYPTRHYKFRVTYGMSMTVMGFNRTSKVARDEETWTTTKIDTSALSRWVKKVPKTMNEALDKLMAMEREKVEGLPLKMISAQTMTESNGKSQTTKTTMEVVDIQTLKADPASLEIPADYKEMKLDAGDEEGGEDTGKGAKGPEQQIPAFLKMLKK